MIVVSWLRPRDRPTDRQTMSVVELFWTAKKDDKYKDDGDNNMMMKQKT